MSERQGPIVVCDDGLQAQDPPPAVPNGFEVRDHSSANWLVRKVVEARAYAEHVKAWAAMEIRRAEREERFFLDHYEAQLDAWARQQIARLHRAKSLKLPAGTVGYRAEPARLEVGDEAKLVSWCRRNLPDALRVQTHVLRSLVKDHVEKTGECPDGAEIGGGAERFYIR